jgi:hypothetical protein
MKPIPVLVQVSNEHNKLVSIIKQFELFLFFKLFCHLAAEQALATTALKRSDQTQRGLSSPRISRGGGKSIYRFSCVNIYKTECEITNELHFIVAG